MPYQTESAVHPDHEQLREMRAIRASLESIETMLRKLSEISEAQALSISRGMQHLPERDTAREHERDRSF
jgi:hypothetical protein